MDVYQYFCGTGLIALVFLHHAVLSIPINCLHEMVEVRLLSGHLFDSMFSNVSSNSMPVRMQSHIGCICLTFLHCASLNVSSNCLPEKRHSRTDYICLAFLNCVFSNVFSKRLHEQMQSHIGCICLSFLHCVFSCASSDWRKFCNHCDTPHTSMEAATCHYIVDLCL